ncbi:MAG TPA: LysE family translocator [Casimicrobium huifangae]|uniref:LysE family translocator n=1 Tax=Casimicrobium huifangae TaxID=2591109 RepID=UPI0012EC219E|nr:LysE family translocator [Casimicrobium huifangae]HOA99938.1 LysE family translocator [Casimicrobium huifangae]HQA32587.1 LysE family translocator [Casimicrobium huifangae]
MLSLDQTLLYLPAVAIIIAIPGPDMLLSLSRGLTQGRTAGCAHACGAGVGIMGHSLLAAFGVSALLTASQTAFWVMKLVGGAYLIYLGIQQWRSAAVGTALVTAKPAPLRVIFMRGVLSNLLNPKVALFVLAFVPQFVRAGEGASSPLIQMLLLGAIFSVLTIIAYSALGAAAGSVNRWLATHPAWLRGVNRGSAGLFVASGAAVLLLDRRQ